jgi:glyoxylase-like metal-dependent hydrolase (beta-lactamase superfamily II)
MLGRYDATIVSAGTFALDGGAMFGIIPKPLWEKKIPADDKNRIPMGTNCLLLRDGQRTVLVDCGMGTKWADKQKEQFKVETRLDAGLAAAGCALADVTDVVLTHLHFDHAGGLTRLDGQGALAMSFPNARVHVGRRNWEWAQRPNDRDRGSYRDDSWRPLLASERDRLVLVDDVHRRAHLFDDIDAIFCEGHTTGQMLPLVGRGSARALYGADMVPTRAHVRVPWIMGYDLRPIELLDEKRQILGLCAGEGVALVYEHDATEPVTGIARDGDDFTTAPLPLSVVQPATNAASSCGGPR